jgi:hypothetical protein
MKPAISIVILVGLLAACGKSEQPGTTAGLPVECDAYVTTVTTCVDKVSGSNPGAAMFKQQMEAAKAEWAKISDKSTLGATCRQMEESFKRTAAASLHC